mgnify:CR=1 FL=1
MYARFYRWAFDRLDNNGIVAFVTNRSFIDSRTFDGFRKCIQQEFDYAYLIDTKSDVRANPKISGTGHNVFGIQTGVAIMLLVKKATVKKIKNDSTLCQIQYFALNDFWKKEEKLQWFTENPIQKISFEHIRPDKNNNWVNIADTDFQTLLPLCDKSVKLGKSKNAIFKFYTLGLKSNRDEWVLDYDELNLCKKVEFLINKYSAELTKLTKIVNSKNIGNVISYEIKWTRKLKRLFLNKMIISFDKKAIINSLYRPFSNQYLYFSRELNEDPNQVSKIFSEKGNVKNKTIIISGTPLSKPFHLYITDEIFHHDTLEKTQGLSLYCYENGELVENITDWGLNQFTKQYGKKGISKESIFHYVYAVLHNPVYRKKYELNLKREFPRIPFYKDFKKWSDWGKTLMDLHLNYETVKPFALKEVTTKGNENPKCKLKADKETGIIILDDVTTLSGIPKQAWDYKLGNRSALEWVLDQYKEKKPSDPTIAEKFNTYKFADYKVQVIDLLKRVCTVSVETMKIVNQMEEVSKAQQ